MRAIRILIGAAAICAMAPAAAENELFAVADQHARAGEIAEMERTYETLLAVEPNNLRALNGLATARAWRGKYDAAEATYDEILARDPDNLEALRGQGYARAWAGQYEGALYAFERAQAVAPGDFGSRKGTAYVYLWSGDYARAEETFSTLAEEYPGDAEILTALGQAQLQRGENRDAVDSFKLALATDPTWDAALSGRRAAWNATPMFEASAWYGSTSNAGSGLRMVELAWWASEATRLSVRYDDSLSLDNPALVRSGETAETYLAGVTHRIGSRWSVTADAGLRQLPDGDQNLYRGELSWNHELGRITLGSQLGDHDLGYDDTLNYVGAGIPIGSRWRIESTYYSSETGPASNEEWRTIVNTEYRGDSGWSLLVGGGFGRVETIAGAGEDDVEVAHAIAFLPVFGYHRINLTLRREQVGGESYNIAMLGFTYRFARNEERF